MIHLKEECQIQQKIKRLLDTIESLEILLEQKEQRIEELEAEVGLQYAICVFVLQWNLCTRHTLGLIVLSLVERLSLSRR